MVRRVSLFAVLGTFLPAIAFAAVQNPSLPQDGSCGLDIAIVLDSSGSIDATELAQMKAAYHSFVNTFLPATPTRFSVIDFDLVGRTLLPFSSDRAAINAAIDQPTSGGATNWEQGLQHAANTFDPRASVANLILFASDGQPNTISPTGYTPPDYNSATDMSPSALAAAVEVADAIKASGTRILALGIGTGGNSQLISNLKQISGPKADAGRQSDVISTDFSSLASDLADIAANQCGGTVSVTKLLDRDGDLATKNDQSVASSWDFNIAGYSHTTGERGSDVGKTSPQRVSVRNSFDVRETSALAAGSFLGAQCINANHGNTSIGTPGALSVTGIVANDQDIISCTFINDAWASSNGNLCPTCPKGYELRNGSCTFVGCPVGGCTP
jgi:hypothetical protein